MKDWDIHDPNQKMTIADFAWSYAEYAHRGQTRRDGSAYFEHPCRVAKLVRKYRHDCHDIEALTAAAYLHDLLEDTATTYYDLVQAFGYQIASLVLELTTNPEMKAGIGDKGTYMCYKLKHMTSWALSIKLCDRLDNMSDLRGCTNEWTLKYLFETVCILGYLEKNRDLSETCHNIMNDLWARCREVAGQLQVDIKENK